MKDIAGATQAQALDALEWSARTLVEAALTGRGKTGPLQPYFGVSVDSTRS
jgi:hypothetical protein